MMTSRIQGLTTRVGEQRTKNSTDEKTARDAEGFKYLNRVDILSGDALPD